MASLISKSCVVRLNLLSWHSQGVQVKPRTGNGSNLIAEHIPNQPPPDRNPVHPRLNHFAIPFGCTASVSSEKVSTGHLVFAYSITSIPAPSQAGRLKETLRVTRPGGAEVFITPSKPILWNLLPFQNSSFANLTMPSCILPARD